MVFSSLIFLFIFLPFVLLFYYSSPRRIRNAVLFAVSLVFYAWGEPIYIVLMLITTLTDYGFGLLLSSPKLPSSQQRMVVVSSVVINLAILSFFKYADFIIANINAVFGSEIPLTDLPLPIGISFYIFQSLSYIIDVYRGQVKAQRNWLDFGMYVALFPQLVAGPIVQYSTVSEQIKHRRENMEQFAEGVRRFIIGLAKKVLLANNIGLLWETISTSPLETMPMLTAWLGILAFALQIYFDFSGYSDMAIGLGLMFGFRFNENFNKPYISQSITEFWRRWHISLGSWFRNYVYIPLGGNRHGLAKQIRNIMIVWLLTGFWHGASWNFIFWGLYFGVILMFEKWWGLQMLARWPSWTRHVYALVLILFGWVLFAFEEIDLMASFFSAMLGINGQPFWDSGTLYFLYTNVILFIIMILCCLPWDRLRNKLSESPWLVGWYVLLFLVCIAYLVDGTFNPFLYFRF